MSSARLTHIEDGVAYQAAGLDEIAAGANGARIIVVSKLPDLSSLYAKLTAGKISSAVLPAAYALASDLATTNSQVTQLQTVTADIGELTVTAHLPTGWTSATSYIQWVAPYACQVLSAQVMSTAAITLDATNFWSLDIGRARANVSVIMATKTTAQEAMAVKTNWSFDGVTWNTSNATLQKGDGLYVVPTNHGTATGPGFTAITLVVQPL